jgi:hypothetical protein
MSETGKPGPEKRPKIEPRQKIDDSLIVAEKDIVVIPTDSVFSKPSHLAKLESKREWFTGHFYKCLPLVFGNQHGFVMLSTYDFVVRWNGSAADDGVSVHILSERDEGRDRMFLLSHFGNGILTIQSRYIFRTAPGVNLMVKEPPNYPIDGFSWMNAVVETDNLRRDFTFNIKITRPQMDIFVARNTPIGCIVPYPRFFLDDFKLTELTDAQELQKARVTCNYFGEDRVLYGAVGQDYRYMEGVDIFGCPFNEHQKSLDGGEWWRKMKAESDSDV